METSGRCAVRWEIPCNAKKWASDDTPNLKTIGVTPCDPANFVKPLQWEDLFVRGDLQNRIGGGVENRTPGLNVLRAELLEDCSAAPRAIADELNRRFAFDCAAQFVGETLERCERLIENYSRDLPMAGVVSLPAERSFIRP